MASHTKRDLLGGVANSYEPTSAVAFGATVNPNTLTSVFDPRFTFPSSSLTNGTNIEACNNTEVNQSSARLSRSPGIEVDIDTKLESLVDEDESTMHQFDSHFYSIMNTNTNTTSSASGQPCCQSPRSISGPEADWIPSMPRRNSNSLSLQHASVDSLSSVESILQQQGIAGGSLLPYDFQTGCQHSVYPSVSTANIFGGRSDYPDPSMRDMYGAGFPVMYDQQAFATFSPDLALQSSQGLPMDMPNVSGLMVSTNGYPPNMFMSSGFSPATGPTPMPLTGTRSSARRTASSKVKPTDPSHISQNPSMNGHIMPPITVDGCSNKKKAPKPQKNKQPKQKLKKQLSDQPALPNALIPVIPPGIRSPPPVTARPAKKPAVEFIDDPTSNSSKKNKSKRKEMNRVAARRHREKMKEKLRDYEEKRIESDRTIEEGDVMIQSLRIAVDSLQREVHMLREEK